MAATQSTNLSAVPDPGAPASSHADTAASPHRRLLGRSSVAATPRAKLRFGASNIARLLRQRPVLIGAAVLLIVLGMAFGQQWLTAASVVPLLISALPCVAMCALGLCMRGQGGQGCGSQSTPQADSGAKSNTGEAQF